jgi:Fe-S-cluster-containing dehydrogenase component
VSAVDRRQFLRLMAASLALAGLGACTRQPDEKILPYVRQPEHLVLGNPLYFATAMPLAGIATGLLVESHEGRPTKVEGNPEHPASLGTTDAWAQASILGLYDPDRSQVVTSAGTIRTWGAFRTALDAAVAAQRSHRGAGLRLLTETVTSPTLAAQIADLLDDFPQARCYQWEPAGRDNARAGSRQAFGTYVETRLQLDGADVILSLDADFLACGPGSLRHARDFARRRSVAGERPNMNRLYVVEGTPTVTGAKADHRLPIRAGDVEAFARAVAAGIGVQVQGGDGELARTHAAWLAAVARDLQDHRGASVVIAGERQPAAVHALAHAMNHALGNVGRTVVYTDPVEAGPTDQMASLRELVAEMDAGTVELLVVLGGNPVYTAPADLEFAARFDRVALRVHLGLYHDETAELSHWHVPEAHYLESWGDTRGWDGTVSILQPLIAPLYGGRSAHEMLALFSDQPTRTTYDIVRDYWQRRARAVDFEAFWRAAVHAGVVPDTALPVRSVALRTGWDTPPAPSAPSDRLEIAFRPDPKVFDGRFANNGWLQELPDPVTKITWDNAALVAPATAERRGLANGDVVELHYQGRTVSAPVWIVPGHAQGAVTVALGYGRRRVGSVGNDVGFDAYRLRTSDAPDFGGDLEMAPTGRTHAFATTQHHHGMDGRPLALSATLAEYLREPHFAPERIEAPAPETSMFPPHPYPGYAWGMAIDLGACIGCNACAVACQAENNIAVVGKEEVARGREMHWIRIDRYWSGDLDNPETIYQPVPCMHCENAPCEVVCPVNATVHSSEGLNEMVYNRCVGTRYCSNNCPYKVRRFNFFLFQDWTTESLKPMRNPDVTVRSRGVMEKCTYCVQRIEEARIVTARENRPIRDGDVLTACQQACPTQAIVFGNVNDPESRVAKLKAEPRNYALLGELGTRPRTTYLAAVRNPNPALAGEETRG